MMMVVFLVESSSNHDSVRMVASFSLGASRVATTTNTRSLSTGHFASMTRATTPTERARTKATTTTRLRSSPSGGSHDEDGHDDREVEKQDDGNFNDAIDDLLTKKDDFLDRPFFDPTRYDEDDESLPGRLANLVKSDYPLAEAAFATVYFVALVVVAKELLRMQLYGSEYVPFAQGVAPGKLF